MTEKPKIAGDKPIVEEVEAGEYYYCSCGESKNQPFCDGSHKGTCFEPIKYEVQEKKRVAWCTCKRSAKMPLCDGAHKKLGCDGAHKKLGCDEAQKDSCK